MVTLSSGQRLSTTTGAADVLLLVEKRPDPSFSAQPSSPLLPSSKPPPAFPSIRRDWIRNWQRTLRQSNFWRVVLAFVAAGALYLIQTEHALSQSQRLLQDTTTTTKTAAIVNRCWDGDKEEAFVKHPVDIEHCKCPDPTKPTKRDDDDDKLWMQHHVRMVMAVRMAPRDLDFVLLGDSITERFNGTSEMGTRSVPELRSIFSQYFEKNHGVTDHDALQGLALGSAGDTTTEWLWHLQNGLLENENLNPKAWVLLVGTNDMERYHCSTNSVFEGIMAVADYLEQKRPGVPVLIHGLLPRADTYSSKDHDDDDDDTNDHHPLGEQFAKIQHLNHQLARQVRLLHRHWHYMDATGLFLRHKENQNDNDPQNDSRSRRQDELVASRSESDGAVVVHGQEINHKFMRDGLHPSAEGYAAWAQALKRKIQSRLLDDMGKRHSSSSENTAKRR